MSYTADFKLLKAGHRCSSTYTTLGSVYAVEDCAKLCRDTKGCQFFIIQNNGGKESCYWQHTLDPSCSEGWIEANFDFYGLFFTTEGILKHIKI